MIIKKQKGFTLVELTVVMGLMALIGGLSVAGLVSSRDQVYFQHVTDRLKSDIRTSFIESISVSKVTGVNDTDPCYNKVPKLQAIQLVLSESFRGYQLYRYCENPTGNGLLKSQPKDIDIINDLKFGRNLSLEIDKNPSIKSALLVFASPNADFYFFEDLVSSDIGDRILMTHNWSKNEILEYSPVSPPTAKDHSIKFSLGTIEREFTINRSGKLE